MRVYRLPRDPGPAAWAEILPRPKPYPTLDHDLSADVLIIGAGFVGLSAAARLQEIDPSARIIILEASQIAAGPAGRNSGFMIDLPHDLASTDYGGLAEKDRAETSANRAAIDFAKTKAAEFEMPQEACVLSGKINGAASAHGLTHNQNYAKHLAQIGEAHEMLDAASMKDLTGLDYYQGGLFTKGTAILQPALYIRELARGITRRGAQVFENSPVVELGSDRVATTPKGRVHASKIILAVNGHANSFGHFKRQLMHVFTYGSMTRRLNPDETRKLGGAPNWGLTPADPMGSTVRRISGMGGDRIVIRNRFTYDPSMEVSDRRLASVAHRHRQSFDARFGMLNDVEMEYVWGGRLCLSRNSVPAFGEVANGVIAACCQNGLGTAKGTAAGIAAAELALGQKSKLASYLLSLEAPHKLPPEPITWLGANAVMRWGEFKAGREL